VAGPVDQYRPGDAQLLPRRLRQDLVIDRHWCFFAEKLLLDPTVDDRNPGPAHLPTHW